MGRFELYNSHRWVAAYHNEIQGDFLTALLLLDIKQVSKGKFVRDFVRWRRHQVLKQNISRKAKMLYLIALRLFRKQALGVLNEAHRYAVPRA